MNLEITSLQSSQSGEHSTKGREYAMPRTNHCTYTTPDHTPCRAFAVGCSRLCHWHRRQAARDRRRIRALHRGCTVRIGPLDSRRAILNAVNRVLQPLAAGTLPVDRASSYLRRIHLAVFRLHRLHDTENHEMTRISHLANPLEPRTVNLEPAPTDLPSPPHHPTIEETPAIRRPSQPAVHNRSHRSSSQGPPVYQNRPLAMDNAQRRTDNAST